MGLHTTHGAWHGPYSAFDHWRKQVAAAIGVDLNQMQGFGGSGSWTQLSHDPLRVLLNHSDCEGEIAAKDCGPIADRLEAILALLPEGDLPHSDRTLTQRFIDGLRLAASKGEAVEFG